jgi:hypothetical protein
VTGSPYIACKEVVKGPFVMVWNRTNLREEGISASLRIGCIEGRRNMGGEHPRTRNSG